MLSRRPSRPETETHKLDNGTLPSVSWIDPHFKDLHILGPDSNDDHAPSDVTAGQARAHDLPRADAKVGFGVEPCPRLVTDPVPAPVIGVRVLLEAAQTVDVRTRPAALVER